MCHRFWNCDGINLLLNENIELTLSDLERWQEAWSGETCGITHRDEQYSRSTGLALGHVEMAKCLGPK